MAKKEYNYISIVAGRLPRYRGLTCVNKWFDNCQYFSFHLYGNELAIKKHYGDTPKFALKRNSAKSFTITDLELPIGKWEINKEDSSEDVLFVFIK
jgi:hypothetical protein